MSTHTPASGGHATPGNLHGVPQQHSSGVPQSPHSAGVPAQPAPSPPWPPAADAAARHPESKQGQPAARAGARAAAGTVVAGRYTLVAPVGAGGMGAVWRATDRLLRREVAVKEVAPPPGMPTEERDALAERTLREARAAAGLSHPSVIRVYDVVNDGGRPWIVMELLKAHSLADLIERDGAMAPRAVAKIGLAMLGALEAAHRAGVLHRDVKPGNVLICADGRCVLTDFGVARSAADAQMTSPGMVLGSPHFISPERATGSGFGPPSDLFSLGVTLYAATEGVAPFDRGNAIATMNAVVNDPPEPPLRAGELTPVLFGLMEKDPDTRWGIEQTRTTLRGFLLGSQGARGSSGGATTALPAAARTSAPAAVTPAPDVAQRAHAVGSRPDSGGAPDSWKVGRAPVRPVSAEPAYQRHENGEPTYGRFDNGSSYGRQARPATPSRPGKPSAEVRSIGAWVFGAAAVLVAMVLVITAVGLTSGWFEPEQPMADEKPPTDAGPPFDTQTYRGQGVSIRAPENWQRKNRNSYVQFHHPDHERAWLRVKVTGDSRPARQILRGADQNFVNGCCGLSDYRRASLRTVKMDGHKGAQLEYTGKSTATGKGRHGMWRIIVDGGKSYEVYMSVPASLFRKCRPVFDEAVRSFRLAS